MRRSQVVMLAVAATVVAGCVGAEHRPHQTVRLSTEPAGAACLVTGGAESIAEVAAAPAEVRLPQSGRDVRVFCTSDGRAPTAVVLPAELQTAKLALATALVGPAPVAGILLGGGGRRYAPTLTVALPPMRFATAEERDRFFAAQAEASRNHFDQPIRAHKGMCRPDEFGCQHMIAGMERARDEELARLEALRAATAPSP